MKRITQKAGVAGVLCLGFLLGVICSNILTDAHAEIRQNEQRAPVPSGALQSAAILEKMCETLRSIDARLARIEQTVQQIADKPAAE